MKLPLSKETRHCAGCGDVVERYLILTVTFCGGAVIGCVFGLLAFAWLLRQP